MKTTAIACAAALTALAAVPAQALTFQYDGFGPPDSISGRFDLMGQSDVIADLSGSVDGAPITSFQSGTYDGSQFTADFATSLASYNLNGQNGFFGVVTINGTLAGLGSLTVASVPLPGSAPMLGIALATLGAVGARRRRKSVSVAGVGG